MQDASAKSKLIRIGIECESIEDDAYGVARIVSKLLSELALRRDLERTHRFILYFNRRIPELPFLNNQLFEKRLVGLPRWGLPGSFSVYYYLLLPLELWRTKPTAMYYPNYMLPLIHPPGVPSLVMMTEDVYREAKNPKLPLRYRAAYLVFSLFWAARRATRIHAISKASRDGLAKEGIGRNRIAVNELAVDTTTTPEPLERNEKGFLWVGQAFERRHLREALAAFTDIAQEDASVTFRLIGPDKYEPPVVEETVRLINRRLNRTAATWERTVDDTELARAYAQAVAVVYVSDTEAFGLPPLEGLAAGAMPVVADVPVAREVYGEHAFYAADASVSAIGSAMRSALDATRRKAVLKAAPTIVARYTWKAHADRFLRIMAQLVR